MNHTRNSENNVEAFFHRMGQILAEAVLKEKMTELHAAYPDVKGMFHVAHSLYVTDRPDEKFPDSKVVDANGKQAVWEDTRCSYISRKRQDAGWKWWIFYPTMDNAFGKAMLSAIDYMLETMGASGMYADGFVSGYARKGYTYDRWDGHSVEIDPQTKTVKRKMGSSEKIRLGEQELTPTEISALILKELAERARQALDRPIGRAVITVPAYFSDAQRSATREAGELAGANRGQFLVFQLPNPLRVLGVADHDLEVVFLMVIRRYLGKLHLA